MSVNQLQYLAREQSDATAEEAKKCLLATLQEIGLPETMLDVGCGSGHLVKLATDLGIRAVGIDIAIPKHHPRNSPFLIQHDLTEPWGIWTAELVLCLEVAEHLPVWAADTLCNTLVGAVESILVFSAATPGQGGAGHLNEQPHEYWTVRLTDRGLTYDPICTETLRGIWGELAPNAWWYSRNLMIFRRTE